MLKAADSRCLRILLVTALGGLLVSFAGCAFHEKADPRPISAAHSTLPRPIRAVWVARFHYQSPESIREIMANCAAMGFNTVIWQVRGQAAVCYPSRLEPWSETYGHRDPGFDPLAIACDEAHRHGMRLEAWMNTMPGWKGPKPAPQGQLWNTNPDWFLLDAAGQRQPLGEFYVILNPALPEVRSHIVAVAEEIATRYPVDGIHLDYVRYAWDTEPGASKKYMRDPRTLDIYRQETGLAPEADAVRWDNWRADQITRIVDGIHQMLRRKRPGATLTAAVWRNPKLGFGNYLQNAATWLRVGLIDVAYPMVYTAKPQQLESDIAMYREAAPGKRIAPGIGVYLIKDGRTLETEMEMTRAWGGDVAIYAYESLVKGPLAGPPANPPRNIEEERRLILSRYIGPPAPQQRQ